MYPKSTGSKTPPHGDPLTRPNRDPEDSPAEPVEKAREIRLKISTAAYIYIAPDTLRFKVEAGLSRVLQHWPDIGPVSISTGVSLFPGDTEGGDIVRKVTRESEAEITLHQATSDNVIFLWLALRDNIPGVDCARIYDRGLSWCAKAYENQLNKSGPLVWPGFTSEPIEVS